MKFCFSDLKEEIVYDNHGCPAATDYRLDFTVDNIGFCVQYRNSPYGYGHMDLLSGSKYIGEIYNNNRDIKYFIEETFEDRRSIANEALHKLKGDVLDNLKENLTKNLIEKNFSD